MRRARGQSGATTACLAGIASVVLSLPTTAAVDIRWVTAEPCLNLRSRPAREAPARRCLPRGARVAVIDSVPDWEQIELDDGTLGWVAHRYLSPEEPMTDRHEETEAPPVPAADATPPSADRGATATRVSDLQPIPPMALIEPGVEQTAFLRLEPFEPLADDPEPVVRKAVFRRRELLTGELVPTRATPIEVPRTRAWGVEIRWLVEDGMQIEAGDPLVEYDTSALTRGLEDQLIIAVESADGLARARVEGDALAAEKILALETARIELEKARLLADVPEGLLSRRELQDRRLELRRAEVERLKAEEELERSPFGRPIHA